MADLVVAGFFTTSVVATGVPAVGLALGDIDIYLTEVDRATGADAVIWDGTQNPTEEVDNVGSYLRILTTADMDANDYFAYFEYTGAAVLDLDHVTGATGICLKPIGTAIEYTYTLTWGAPPQPIVGARIEVSTDIGGTNIIWCGQTDTFGVARDDNGRLPRLEPGTYFFWRSAPGFTFAPNPDTEIVS